jgi:menaquinone-specific isochorismate synthase
LKVDEITMSVNSRQVLPTVLQKVRSTLTGRYDILREKVNSRVRALPLTLSVDIEKADLLAWLKQQSVSPRTYWSSRDGEFEAAGFGSVLSVTVAGEESTDDAYSQIDEILRLCDDDSVLFFGGQAFDTSTPGDSAWAGFTKLQFVVPEVLVTRKSGCFSATTAVKVDADSSIDDVLSRIEHLLSGMRFPTGSIGHHLNVELVSRTDFPDFAGWSANIGRSLEMIGNGSIEKVVIARRTDLSLTEKIDPVGLLAAMKRANRNCFGFMFEPAKGSAFTGVTPERLFRVDQDKIESEAVSGTALFDDSIPGGGAVGTELLSNDKNMREHGFVLGYVEEKLADLCDDIADPSERTLLNLSNVSHIYSKLSGRLRAGLSVGDVVSCMHPTPAVCGISSENALRLIRQLEPFARGWYAGTVGIIRRDYSEMAVAIRSALVSDNKVSLFVGSGIVDGSTPTREWQELEYKIAPALRILGGVLV